MRVLLTEGSGLTSRQAAGLLAASGHEVGVLSSDPVGLARFTRATRHWHRVPQFGADPLRWLDAALQVYVEHGYDVLLPTQEQVAVLAAFPSRLRAAGVVTAVPSFDALRQVQDKLSAQSTLAALSIPQPDAVVLGGQEGRAVDRVPSFPAFAKTPVGTATSGVERVDDASQLQQLLVSPGWAEAVRGDGVLVQQPVDGPLAMVQSVFDGGRLVAFHANLRVRQGVRGGASEKRSVLVPDVRDHVERLGAALGWHGALSADVILGPDGPSFIDINPRLVEPMNAHRSGVDLVGAMLAVALDRHPPAVPMGRADVGTRQLLLAVLGAAQQGRGRRGVLAEVRGALVHQGARADVVEELTPWLARDPLSVLPLALAATATVVSPRSWRWFASGSVANYALAADGWARILASAE